MAPHLRPVVVRVQPMPGRSERLIMRHVNARQLRPVHPRKSKEVERVGYYRDVHGDGYGVSAVESGAES